MFILLKKQPPNLTIIYIHHMDEIIAKMMILQIFTISYFI
jgi:hypothetical protein